MVNNKQNTSEKTINKKIALRVLLGILFCAALYAGYDFYFFVSTDNAQIQANTLILTSRVSGYIEKVTVEEGQAVHAGDVLVEINPKDYESRDQQSKSEVDSLAAKVQEAQMNYQRMEKLYAEGAISLQMRDSTRATAQELTKKLKALQALAEVSKNGLNDTTLRAPTDGFIAKKNAEVGMLANPGTALLAFVSADQRWVIANFKETDLQRLRVGQKAKISVDAISDKTFQGEIEAFYPATGSVFSLLPPDNATGNFTKVVQRVPTKIKIFDLTNEDKARLKAGLSVIVSVRVH